MSRNITVATVLTVYGIETQKSCRAYRKNFIVATVLTVYGIETGTYCPKDNWHMVATVLTVYGIETKTNRSNMPERINGCNSTYRLRY